MRLLTGIALVLLMTASGTASAKGPVSGPGHVMVGVDVSIWDSNLPVSPGIQPILGNGQVNGEFTIAERNGIQIGLRAQERFQGTLVAIPNQNGKVGIYDAVTGTTGGGATGQLEGATWNYDWHVDLRGAFGVAAGTTLSDYDLTLETDISSTTLFNLPLPLDLKFGGIFPPADTVLYQSSQNPIFGNLPFNALAPGTYNFTLVLTPKTFNGPPLKVTIQVNVTDP